MSRLIDADVLLEKLKGTPRYFELKHDIEEQPTAYDMEKVVEQIQEKHCKRCLGAGVYCKEKKCWIEELCEIVRKGGVE